LRGEAGRWALLLAGALLWTGATPGIAAVAETDPELRERVEQLEGELAILKRKLEIKDEQEAAKAPRTVEAGAGAEGFYLRTPDRKFQIRFRGYTHFDGRFFGENDAHTTDTFFFRRIRPVLEGTVGEYVEFRIMPDFAGNTLNLFDAYVNFKYVPELQLEAGKFKPPVGLERLQSATALMFVERGFPTQLVPSRDLGVMLHGDFRGGLVTWQAGGFNGIRDGASTDNGDIDTDDGKDVALRVFAHPFQETAWAPLQGLGLGVAGTWGDVDQTLSTFRTDGGATFFSYRNGVRGEGDRWRISPQLYWYWGPLGLLAEYSRTQQQAKLGVAGTNPPLAREVRYQNQAWQVAASYVITGEDASYRGVVPRTSFNPFKGSLLGGAWEVAARFSELETDDELFPLFADPATAARSAHEWTVGLNWYMNRWTKLVLNYNRTWFDGGAPNGGNRNTEGVVLTRLQLNF
jgi:phosphate-selective porin OprO/OprP